MEKRAKNILYSILFAIIVAIAIYAPLEIRKSHVQSMIKRHKEYQPQMRVTNYTRSSDIPKIIWAYWDNNPP
jgi:mannosyltransferase OCH1-like enzyme